MPAGVSIVVYQRDFRSEHNAVLVCSRKTFTVIGVVVADLQQLG